MIVSAALIACITAVTGLPAPLEMPHVELLSRYEMRIRYPLYANFWGLSFPGLIVMRKGRERQVRAHEYVHHWQRVAGVDPRAPASEAIAVMTQERCGGL